MSPRWMSNLSIFACSLFCALAQGQEPTKWTNPEGKEIEGEFVLMDDKSVTLRQPSGKEVKVLLTSLSLESHLQALKLAKPDNFTKELVRAPQVVEAAQLSFKLTAVNVLASPFDDDPSIDSFMQTFTKELNRGNLFVVWHMLPPKIQTDLSAAISRGLVAAGPTAPNQMRKVFSSLAGITSKKRDWILDLALAEGQVPGAPAIPESQLEPIKNAWPAIVALFTDLSDKSVWDSANFRRDKVPTFLASLLVNAQYFEAMVPDLTYNIVSQSADRAEVEFSFEASKTPAVQFQKVGQIWVAPQLMINLRSGIDREAKNPMGPQVAAGFNQVMAIVLPVLTKLNEAKSKDEFKQVVESITRMIPLPPGGLPRGIPGISGIPGLPGFSGN